MTVTGIFLRDNTFLDYVHIIAFSLFIVGLMFLTSPRTARQGNMVAAVGMAIAVADTLLRHGIHKWGLIVLGLAIGTAVGVPAARSVKMTAMPQMVALFNGVGGGAVALISWAEYRHFGNSLTSKHLIPTLFAAIIGSISFWGSNIAFGKLQEILPGRPIMLPGRLQTALNAVLLTAAVTMAVVIAAGTHSSLLFVLILLAAAILGNAIVLPIGGAVAAPAAAAAGTDGGTVRSTSPADVAIQLSYARQVVIAPGYGMAVAQAQHAVRDLTRELESRGVDVNYAIHPVAGRMPGHMNVLLAEADVPYDQLKEMDDVNPQFPQTDVALVIGANDVTNPAARDVPDSPIYGMPILDVDKAHSVIVLKRSMNTGFAGIDNPLFYKENTSMLFGDAKASIQGVTEEVKAL